MSREKEIADLRRALFGARSNGGVFYATVKSVDPDKRTCVVVDGEEMEYDDVLLYAVANEGLKGWVLIPKADSTVLVGRIGGSNELYVAMFSEVDAALLTVGDTVEAAIDDKGLTLKADTTTLNATDKGLTLARGSAGLKKTISDLCDALAKLTVTTGVGPSGIPINAADFIQIKKELDNYLEQ